MKRDILERLADRLALTDSGCLVWTGGLNRGGYGNVDVDGRTASVHRVTYETVVGPVPAGLDLGHVCHDQDLACPGGRCPHRACAHPDHLQPMTEQENALAGRGALRMARAERCSNGHVLTEANSYVYPNGRTRQCRTCSRESQARTRARRKVTT